MGNIGLWRDNKPKNFEDPWDFMTSFEPFFDHFKKQEDFMKVSCDLVESENGYTLTFDIPGLNREDIQVDVIGNSLSVSGERKYEHESNENNVHRVERSFGKFQRSFRIPEGTNTDDIDAHYKDGVLKLTVPRAEVKKSKKVEIS